MTIRIFFFSFLLIFITTNYSTAQGLPPAKVVVRPVIRDNLKDVVTLIGVTEPWRRSVVAAETTGKVESVEVSRGDKIKKGDIIARLDNKDLLLKLDVARADREAIEISLEKARDDLRRAESLIKDETISDLDYRDKRLAVKELEENLKSAEAKILLLGDELRKKTIKAPFDGIVTDKSTEVGQWVGPGSEIVRLIDLSVVRVIVDVPEKYVSGIHPKQEVKVRVDALGNEVFNGVIHTLIPEGDRNTHIYPVEIYLKNTDMKIKAGMLTRVDFPFGIQRKVIMVHKDALIRKGSQSYVFIVENDRAVQIPVTSGYGKGDFIEVEGPIKEGDLAIIRGNERVRHNQPVSIVPVD